MPKLIAEKIDWIKLGYRLFSEQGISGIIIEKLARELNCNKSSFYWHFKTKREFVNELINYWISKETESVINEVDKAATSLEKYERFLAIAFKNDPYLEFIFFLKRYAKDKPNIQQIINDVDEHRLRYTSDLLHELGYSETESITKARLFYNYLIGYHEMIKNKTQSVNYLIQVKSDLAHFIKVQR